MKKSQAKRILELLSDDKLHSTPEIQRVVYGGDHLGVARIASRISDLRKLGHDIECVRDGNIDSVYWYRLLNRKKAPHKAYVPVYENGRQVRVREVITMI